MEKKQTKNQQEKNQQENQKLFKAQLDSGILFSLAPGSWRTAENLEFTDEFQLTEKPLQIDCTVEK